MPRRGWLDACVGIRACISNPVHTGCRALQSRECTGAESSPARTISGLVGAASPWGDARVLAGGEQDGMPSTLGTASRGTASADLTVMGQRGNVLPFPP